MEFNKAAAQFCFVLLIFMFAGCDSNKLAKNCTVFDVIKFVCAKLWKLACLTAGTELACFLTIRVLQLLRRNITFLDTLIIHVFCIFLLKTTLRHRFTTFRMCKATVQLMIYYIIFRMGVEIMFVFIIRLLQKVISTLKPKLTIRQSDVTIRQSGVTMRRSDTELNLSSVTKNSSISFTMYSRNESVSRSSVPPITSTSTNNAGGEGNSNAIDNSQKYRPSPSLPVYESNEDETLPYGNRRPMNDPAEFVSSLSAVIPRNSNNIGATSQNVIVPPSFPPNLSDDRLQQEIHPSSESADNVSESWPLHNFENLIPRHSNYISTETNDICNQKSPTEKDGTWFRDIRSAGDVKNIFLEDKNQEVRFNNDNLRIKEESFKNIHTNLPGISETNSLLGTTNMSSTAGTSSRISPGISETNSLPGTTDMSSTAGTSSRISSDTSVAIPLGWSSTADTSPRVSSDKSSSGLHGTSSPKQLRKSPRLALSRDKSPPLITQFMTRRNMYDKPYKPPPKRKRKVSKDKKE